MTVPRGPHPAAHDGGSGDAFAEHLGATRALLEGALGRWLETRRARVERLHPSVAPVFAALVDLTLRGGKRQRAALVGAGFFAAGGASLEPCLPAMIAIELLQTYFLVHDDWMDGDELRRGAPTVHVILRERFGDSKIGESLAILAGDHANALAFEALLETDLPAERVLEAARAFASMQETVIAGQVLDVRGDLATPEDVEQMYRLKTGAYTLRGPLLLGSALAGGSAELATGLAAFAEPLGIAFQLRDDLLGAFGDERVTGKPQGTDLRRGKRTALVVAMLADPRGRELLAPVLGVPDASSEDVDGVLAFARAELYLARIEGRIRSLQDEARRVLETQIKADDRTKRIFGAAVAAVGERTA